MRNRRIKLLISLIYLAISNIFRLIQHISGRKLPGKCIVIYYHNVRPDEKEKFIRQMNLIKKHAIPVRAGDELKLENEKTYVAITFDDGYQSILDNAIPEMIKLKIPCTIFIPTHYIGSIAGWKNGLNEEDISELIMNERQIAELSGDLVTIGSHSDSHPVFKKLSLYEAQNEFVKSKEILEAICGKEITLFSFPYGEFDTKSAELAHRSGYKAIFTIDPEIYYSEYDPAFTGRFAVNPSSSGLEFKLIISGAYIWMGKISSAKIKLKNTLHYFKLKALTVLNVTKISSDLR